MPWELDQVLDQETIRRGLDALCPLRRVEEALDPGLESSFARIAVLESSLYMRNQLLRDTDWASMAHSLEVRVPLVDATLLAKVAPLVARTAVVDSKSALARAPRTPLPSVITHRAKTGFGVPIGDWMGAASRKNAPSGAVRGRGKGRASRDWSRLVLSGQAA